MSTRMSSGKDVDDLQHEINTLAEGHYVKKAKKKSNENIIQTGG